MVVKLTLSFRRFRQFFCKFFELNRRLLNRLLMPRCNKILGFAAAKTLFGMQNEQNRFRGMIARFLTETELSRKSCSKLYYYRTVNFVC